MAADDRRRGSRARGDLTDAPRPVVRPRLGVVPAEAPNWPESTKRAFLEELSRYGNVTTAATVTGLHRGSLYALRRKDPEFAAAWDEAVELGVEGLEAEATRRATEGVRRPLLYKGRPALDYALDDDGKPIRVLDDDGKPEKDDDGNDVYLMRPAEVREYSDPLLIQLLKAHRPERYKDRATVEHSGSVAARPPLDLSKLSAEELKTLIRLTEKARPEEPVDVTPEKG